MTTSTGKEAIEFERDGRKCRLMLFGTSGFDTVHATPTDLAAAGFVPAAKLKNAEQKVDDLRDRMDVMQREHEETKGYRQHAEQQLEAAEQRVRDWQRLAGHISRACRLDGAAFGPVLVAAIARVENALRSKPPADSEGKDSDIIAPADCTDEPSADGEKDSSPSGAPPSDDGDANRVEPRRSRDPDGAGATYEPCLEFVYDTGTVACACSRPRGHEGAHNSRWTGAPLPPAPADCADEPATPNSGGVTMSQLRTALSSVDTPFEKSATIGDGAGATLVAGEAKPAERCKCASGLPRGQAHAAGCPLFDPDDPPPPAPAEPQADLLTRAELVEALETSGNEPMKWLARELAGLSKAVRP